MSWIGDKAEATANVLKDLLTQTPAAKLYRQGLPNVLDALLNTREEEWRSKMQAMPKPFESSPEAINRDLEAAMAFWNPAGMVGKIVYHGSPHKFDKFDASKIGTGEGAQAYGHGIYMADAEGTAKTYQNMAPTEVVIGDKRISGKMGTEGYGDPVTKAWNEVTAAHGGQFQNPFATAKEWLGGKYGPRNKIDEEAIRVIEDWQRGGARVEEGGALYKADLPDEWIPKMLDWDKPIKELPQPVQQNIYNKLTDIGIDKGVVNHILNNKTGQELMNELAGRMSVRNPSPMPGSAQASQLLREAGIPGIRYLDGGSRGKGQGSYNYVVFPGLEDKVKILERNGQPVNALAEILK